jgi:hypothetical protein
MKKCVNLFIPVFFVFIESFSILDCFGQQLVSSDLVISIYEATLATIVEEESCLAHYDYLSSQVNRQDFIVIIPDSLPLVEEWRGRFGINPFREAFLCNEIRKRKTAIVLKISISNSNPLHGEEITVGLKTRCFYKNRRNNCKERIFPNPIGATTKDYSLRFMVSRKNDSVELSLLK